MYIVSPEESDWKFMEAHFLSKPLVSIKDFPFFSQLEAYEQCTDQCYFMPLKFMLAFSLMHPSEGPGTRCVKEITVPLASEMISGCCNTQHEDAKAQRLEPWKKIGDCCPKM